MTNKLNCMLRAHRAASLFDVGSDRRTPEAAPNVKQVVYMSWLRYIDGSNLRQFALTHGSWLHEQIKTRRGAIMRWQHLPVVGLK